MRFATTLWNDIAPIYEAILAHPFNQELTSGTLSKERFEFYIKQDALYLMDFAKALSIVAAKSEGASRIVDFVKFAEGAIVAERGLHEFYLEFYGTTLDVSYAPACFAYTNYMLATAALRSYEEGVAALLPCFWIYREVGNHVFARASALAEYDKNPYRKWIEQYSSPEFSAVVDKMIAITDEVASDATEKTRAKMRDAFVVSSRLEWLFWDGAYRLEAWKP
ncbi:MAG: thiaminase II [Chloroherpetonaceae bacterium]|nr:thiaminase II [Chloroherpetonaceae bacterium]